MNRLYVSVVIFIAIIAASWCALYSLERRTEELVAQVDRCIAAYESDGGDGDISEQLDRLESCWEGYYSRISFLTRSASLEELAVSVSRLRDLLENQGGDFQSELNALKYRAIVLYESQLPLPQSIF